MQGCILETRRLHVKRFSFEIRLARQDAEIIIFLCERQATAPSSAVVPFIRLEKYFRAKGIRGGNERLEYKPTCRRKAGGDSVVHVARARSVAGGGRRGAAGWTQQRRAGSALSIFVRDLNFSRFLNRKLSRSGSGRESTAESKSAAAKSAAASNDFLPATRRLRLSSADFLAPSAR